MGFNKLFNDIKEGNTYLDKISSNLNFVSRSSSTELAVDLGNFNLDIFNLIFRLGPFGFLTMETEEAPGNLGLRDQSLALEWIKNEASNFCGDPNRISIFGSGSGATSAILQMISPFNQGKNLFNGVIAQSGSPVMNSIFEIGNRKKTALALASDVGCKNTEVSIYSRISK